MIRLQEINSQPQSVVKSLFKDDPWTQCFKDLLSVRGYVGIRSEQMQGLLLVLFTKREHLLHITEVETEYTRTGLGGIWVNIKSKQKFAHRLFRIKWITDLLLSFFTG